MNRLVYGDKRIYWLWMVMICGVGKNTVWSLRKHYDNIRSCAMALKDGSCTFADDSVMKNAQAINFDEAQKLIEDCEKKDIAVIHITDDEYPKKLRRISCPPPVLFVKGRPLRLSSRPVIAFGGTRKPDPASIKTIRTVISQFAQRDAALLTGFEPGIDREVFTQGKKNFIEPVAVSGKGILEDSEEFDKEEELVGGGTIISEFTDRDCFGNIRYALRNRILCGAADALVIVECGANSNGLKIAQTAREQGKPVFVLPPADITDERYFGQRDLLKTGAYPLYGAADVFDVIDASLKTARRSSASAQTKSRYTAGYADKMQKDQDNKNKNKNTPDHEAALPYPAANKKEKITSQELERILSTLSDTDRKIYSKLESCGGTMVFDELIRSLGLDVREAMLHFMELKMAGLINELPGRVYELAKRRI